MKTILGTIMGLLVLALLAVALWSGGAHCLQWLGALGARLEPEQWLALGGILAVLAVAQGFRGARRRASLDQIREARRPVYEAIAIGWQGAWRAAGGQCAELGSCLPRDWAAVEDLLLLRASPAVLRDYRQLLELTRTPAADEAAARQQLLKLVLRMRRELEVSGPMALEQRTLEPWCLGGEFRANAAASAPTMAEPPSGSVLPVTNPALSLAGR